VGITEEKAKEDAAAHGFELGIAKTSFKANSKASSVAGFAAWCCAVVSFCNAAPPQ
jgi:hypothetical protein